MQVQNLCEVCGTIHQPNQCPAIDMNNMPMEEVQAIGNYQRQPNNPNSMTYTLAWKNHPNFSWSNNQNTLQPYPPPQPQYQPAQNRPPYPQQYAHQNPPPSYYQPAQNRPPVEPQSDVLNQFMTETRASIRSLETQIGQLATLMSNRAQGNLPSTTEVNPKEQCNAISLRSGTKYEGPTVENKGKKLEDQYVTSPAQEEVTADFLKKEKSNEEKVTEDLNKKEVVPPVSIDHHVRIPYPQRLCKHNLDKQFAKFLEVFKKLHINILFAEALEQMPSYVKFMKEILSKKKKLEDYETVALTEECSAILQKKLPPKLKDPGNFNIPCSIGSLVETKALCDLGASVNLMPLSIFQKLNLGEARPTTMSLQMANKTVNHSHGVIEDVLVKVGKFIFPADFIILDMEEDENIPIILGRPFLATGRALIDVQKGELKLRVQKEEVIFKVFAAIEIPTCCRVEVVNQGENKLEGSKTRSIVKTRMRKGQNRLKKYFSERLRMLYERGKVPISNHKKRGPTHDTMALKDVRGGLDPRLNMNENKSPDKRR
ncbi:uncharacterized protein LOC133804693 [Humulus lupulus]|uniref:uncharacterized protein LOC133804693 n=1 Tax=Humulus lupulus TaxID=3486 RepID=UPI002B4060C0|nr:uncharacterized protein LOC133804693 [Humulus lupulus]